MVSKTKAKNTHILSRSFSLGGRGKSFLGPQGYGVILILVASPSLKICQVIGSLTVTGESGYQKTSKTELTRININPGDQVR
jgi:hypothetical protein